MWNKRLLLYPSIHQPHCTAFFIFVFYHTRSVYIIRSIFYIDAGDLERNEPPRIYSSAMDGSSPVAIVTSGLYQPLHIAVDNPGVNGRIFWTDSVLNQVMTASLSGENPTPAVG